MTETPNQSGEILLKDLLKDATSVVRTEEQLSVPSVESVGTDKIRRVGICLPLRGDIYGEVMQNYFKLFLWFMKQPNIVPIPIFSSALGIENARNELAKNAIIQKCDYTLWLDSDIIIVEPDLAILFETIQKPEYDFVSGIYYERAEPFNPVLRMEDDFDKMKGVFTYPEDRIFEVHGAGFGCLMMKRKVLDSVFSDCKGKPFQFDGRCSEDLFFCRQARAKGFKLWAHPSIQCGHYGAWVTQWHYKHYKADEYIRVQELCEYTKEDYEVALEKVSAGPLSVFKQWKRTFGERKSEDIPESEVEAFYKTCEYIYDLSHYWEISRGRRNQIFSYIQPDHLKVLDFGCGIGDYGLFVAEDNQYRKVDFYDINEKNLSYLTWRIDKRLKSSRLRASQCRVSSVLNDFESEKYDIIFALDVLEHMKDPAKAIKWIYDHLKPEGILIGFIAPKEIFQPQHISEAKLEDHNFVNVGDLKYMRSDSDFVKTYRHVIYATQDKQIR